MRALASAQGRKCFLHHADQGPANQKYADLAPPLRQTARGPRSPGTTASTRRTVVVMTTEVPSFNMLYTRVARRCPASAKSCSTSAPTLADRSPWRVQGGRIIHARIGRVVALSATAEQRESSAKAMARSAAGTEVMVDENRPCLLAAVLAGHGCTTCSPTTITSG